MGGILKFLGALFLVIIGGCALLLGGGIYATGKVTQEVKTAGLEADLYRVHLKIDDGWKWVKDGDYSYIRGRVKNTGAKTVRYWAVSAKFLDKKNEVIDQDYTNSNERLRPGEGDTFEIMHKVDSKATTARVEVSEVRLE